MATKSANKSILCALGFITLSAISISAFAQSPEYRRGYDQGYRDGIEAQNRQGQENGSAGRIIIEEASYGTRNSACDLRDAVQEAVGWRRNISITANNKLCGDPAPNQAKKLNVRYRCGDGQVFRAQAREGGTLTLNCR